MSRVSTILPPPSDRPVPMPEPPVDPPESGSWKALVAETRQTVKPPARPARARKR